MKTLPADYFVRATEPLRPADAVAALLVHDDGRYVMQLRDAVPQIFYPNHWGCFGGAVDAGETPPGAPRGGRRRENKYPRGGRTSPFQSCFFSRANPAVYRIYYEVRVGDDEFRRFVLHEGAEMRAFAGGELLAGEQVAPYDAFAIWMHMSRRRFLKTGRQ